MAINKTIDRLIDIIDGKVEVAPDCTTREARGQITHSPMGILTPVYCANCHKPAGVISAGVTFAFALCDDCVDQHGGPANAFIIPDQIDWARLAVEHLPSHEQEISV